MDVEPLLLTEITTPDWHPIPNTRLPVYGYLIRHPDGPILVDTGVGSGNAFIDAQYRPETHSLPQALAACGVAVAEVRLLINTHLHFDHCGQNALFPGVPIWVQVAEVEAAHAERYTVREWVDFEGAQYRAVEGEVEVVPSVRVVPARWHTPGHQTVVVEGREGLTLIAGQAAETMAEFQTAEACRALRALRPARVYISHEAP